MLTIKISRRAALLLVVGMLLAIPLGAWASNRFTDVPTTNFHHNNISWLAQAGITQGCGDGTTYCPKDPVTREEMATFLARQSDYLSNTGYSIRKDSDTELPVSAAYADYLTLSNLKAGDYVVVAKGWFNNASTNDVTMDCRIIYGSQSDRQRFLLPAAEAQSMAFTMAVSVVSDGGQVRLQCEPVVANLVAHDLKITAFGLNSLNTAQQP